MQSNHPVLTLPKPLTSVPSDDSRVLCSRADYSTSCFVGFDSSIPETATTPTSYGLQPCDWAMAFLREDLISDLRDYAMYKGWTEKKWQRKLEELDEHLEEVHLHRVFYGFDTPSFSQLLGTQVGTFSSVHYLIRLGSYRKPLTCTMLDRTGKDCGSFMTTSGKIQMP